MAPDFSLLKNILGINQRNLDFISVYNPRAAYPLVDNKVQTKKILKEVGVPFPRTLAVVSSFVEISRTIDELVDETSFVIKPARGRAGGGVILVEKKGLQTWQSPSGRMLTREDLETHLGNILFGVYSFGRMDDCALIEQRVLAHPFFKRIFSRGIADIRVILFKEQPVMAMLRVPTASSDGKANLHQGAMAVQVALNSGITGQGLFHGKPVSAHPDTGAPISGLSIPFWDQIISYSHTASQAVPLKYVGIDLVVDRDAGPLVLELNARPGLQIQVANQSGLNPELAKIGTEVL